jgi:hypothetical protein
LNCLSSHCIQYMKMINLRDEITAWQPLGDLQAARSSVSSSSFFLCVYANLVFIAHRCSLKDWTLLS